MEQVNSYIPVFQIFLILLILGVIFALPVIPARIAKGKKNFFGGSISMVLLFFQSQ